MKKTITLIILGILSTISVVLCWTAPFFIAWSIVLTSATIGSFLFYLITALLNHKLKKIALLLQVICILIVALFIILYYTGFLSHFSSIEEIQSWFDSFGAFAWIIFFLIQLLQVVILPIPAQLTTIAGVLIFGPLIAFIISDIAIILGSIICFAIGKYLGVKIAYKIAQKETVDKYRKLLAKKGKVLLPIMFLLPAFPDDLLCFVAGTTKLKWLYFIIVVLITRSIGIGLTCWFGSGEIIPFNSWGIPVWIVIAILLTFAIYFLIKYQEIIEEWIVSLFTKGGIKKLKAKKIRQKQNEIIKSAENSQKQNSKEYVNFEKADKTKDEFVNFENLKNSKGIE